MTLPTLATAALLSALLAPAAAAPPPGDVADPPAGDPSVLMRLSARGQQDYVCKAPAAGGPSTWTFQEPAAVLTDGAGRAVGRHFRGPTWRLDDGSSVTGRVVATHPGATPQDVAWLRLEVVGRSGTGGISAARTVLRVRTHGGALAGPCPTPGALRAAPYTADYVFLR